MVSRRQSCILIRVLCAVTSLTYAASVSEVPCPKGSECDTITHSTCTSGKCQCSTGFVEDLNDGSTCVQVYGTACTGSSACPGDVHSLCKNDKCACADNYEEKNGVCTQIYGTACTGNSVCPGAVHSLCKNDKCACADSYEEKNGVCTLTLSSKTCSANGNECDTVQNAECDVTSLKCKCSEGYVMNVDDCHAENAVIAVNSIACTDSGTECNKVQNAECDVTASKCKCSDGYVMNVGVCAQKNAASTLKCGAATLLLYVIMAVCK